MGRWSVVLRSDVIRQTIGVFVSEEVWMADIGKGQSMIRHPFHQLRPWRRKKSSWPWRRQLLNGEEKVERRQYRDLSDWWLMLRKSEAGGVMRPSLQCKVHHTSSSFKWLDLGKPRNFPEWLWLNDQPHLLCYVAPIPLCVYLSKKCGRRWHLCMLFIGADFHFGMMLSPARRHDQRPIDVCVNSTIWVAITIRKKTVA